MNPDQAVETDRVEAAWTAYAVVAALVAAVAAVWWARDRGLDLTDEGLYLQLYAHPDAVPPDSAVLQYHRLVSLLDGPQGFGVVGYRVMGLVALLLGAAVLAFGVYRFVATWLPEYRATLPPGAVGGSLIMLSGLLGYTWAPLTISYNTLAAAMTELIIGLALLALAAVKRGSGRAHWVYAACSGAATAVLFYVKWPAVVPVTALVLILVFATLRGRGWRLLGVFAVAAVLVGWAATDGVGLGPFSLSEMREGSALLVQDEYRPGTLLLVYVLSLTADVIWTVSRDPLRSAALLALVGSGAVVAIRGPTVSRWARVAALVAGVYLLLEIPGASYLETPRVFRFVVGVLVALGISAFVVRVFRDRALPELWVSRWSVSGVRLGALLVVLLGVPIATAVGSDSPILIVSMHGGAGYGAALVVGFAAFGRLVPDGQRLLHDLALPIVAIVLAAQVGEGVVIDPYRLPASRFDHTETVEGIARLEGIRFDETSAEFLRESHALVTEHTGFSPGDHVFAFGLLPGLVYSIDASAPGALWVLPSESSDQGRICTSMATVPDRLATTSLIIQNAEPSLELAQCMSDLIPGYPTGWVEAGRVAISDGYGAGTGPGETLRVLVPAG